jgi:CRISPR type III-B/RAMP module-associated protein Cmr5
MKAKIEKHIHAAVGRIRVYYAQNDRKPIKKEYKSYLSSLGASVIMSGLLPTLAVYYNKEGKADRTEVITWVFDIIRPLHHNCEGKEDLFEYALSIAHDQIKTDELIEDILNISIALKLSLRTYPLSK